MAFDFIEEISAFWLRKRKYEIRNAAKETFDAA